ncbi:Inner Nuclear Membrane Protein A [Hibiscus trionum]|uniref:Inner Nuclear Membrane Protein A n=1 Tax=Hibiscus trionum TaxID=183268 RepID=A0A9W7HXJ2_HIBTR|nr:Inner Nuclear Membrane Protein A [Hibiscus trionum]
MPISSASSSSSWVLLFLLPLFFISHASHVISDFKGIDLASPAIDVTPTPLSRHSSVRGSKDFLLCDRVRVSGHSRLRLGSYASSLRVYLAPSVLIPERSHSKIQVCFHRNASLGLCKCGDGDWKALQNGVWHTVMSPYDDRYIDVKFIGDVSGSVTVSVKEEFQRWRLMSLALGFVLLLLAPFISKWVPFYYSSSMAIGVFLVIIILLFQGMKLLPTGRKSALYITIYGSVLGAGSFLLHQFSVLVNSILVNSGLSEEMHNLASIFVLVGIVLSGAALGYWIVRKFVISKDGSVDVGVAQFVKWAMRIIATTFIFQSTLDTLLAMVALASCSAICSLITSTRRNGHKQQQYFEDQSPWLYQPRQRPLMQGRAEFLSRSPRTDPNRKMLNGPETAPARTNSRVRLDYTKLSEGAIDHQDYYSTFHKTRNRKKFTEQEWEDFGRESTREAMAELVASPEFTDWMIEHADRIKLLPGDDSSDESVGSKSSSEYEDEESYNPFRLFSL